MDTSGSPPPDDDASLARLGRTAWAGLETIHMVTFLAEEPMAAYRQLGLRGWGGYFASRSAPLGIVDPDVVVATFYSFAPSRVRRALPPAWEVTTPAAVLEARRAGTTTALHGALGDPDVR